MIDYNPKNWFGLIFQFHRSDTFRKMTWVLLAFGIYTFLVVYLELKYQDWFNFKGTTQIHSLLGFVIGLLLVFRTNTAYERWWEGRKQWGSLVNNTRNLSFKINSILPASMTAERIYFKKMIPNYVYAMKEHLRQGVLVEELDGLSKELLEKVEMAEHVPNIIAKDMYTKLHKLYKENSITGDQLITIDGEIKSLTDILGACERIRKTPIPYSYSLFLKKFIFAYTLTMPFGLAYDFNYWTIPITTFILYVFGSIELLAEEIENPFGIDTNDLPTDRLAKTIKSNVIEIIDA